MLKKDLYQDAIYAHVCSNIDLTQSRLNGDEIKKGKFKNFVEKLWDMPVP